MGIILQGILGGFSGKVGPVVGAKWKSIDYMRSYVIPSNPNTAGQQTQRTKFSVMVALARQALSIIIQPFWDMFYTDMSGFNKFISLNIGTLDGSNKLVAGSIMAKGTLESIPSIVATYATGTGVVNCVGSGVPTGNGLTTDAVYVVAYDKVSGDIACEVAGENRSNGDWSLTFTAGLTATNVIAWVFCQRGTGSELVVSDSVGDVCAAP